MQSEVDQITTEKNKKRRLKTPFQVEALEKFYNGQKYPSEAMKSQLASDLGLSEKQIQGWFCHRRLKDKKLLTEAAYSTGQTDVQTSLHDCNSGVRHDSCSSSKQGEHFLYDFKEVESQRENNEEYFTSASVLSDRYLLARNYSVMDDSSSESSASQDGSLHADDPSHGQQVGYSSCHSNYQNMNAEGRTAKGYIKVFRDPYLETASGHPSISAVKRKLGRQFRDDGPPLGVEFQAIPPGAFESPIRDPLNEPYYVGESIPHNSWRPAVEVDSDEDVDLSLRPNSISSSKNGHLVHSIPSRANQSSNLNCTREESESTGNESDEVAGFMEGSEGRRAVRDERGFCKTDYRPISYGFKVSPKEKTPFNGEWVLEKENEYQFGCKPKPKAGPRKVLADTEFRRQGSALKVKAASSSRSELVKPSNRYPTSMVQNTYENEDEGSSSSRDTDYD